MPKAKGASSPLNTTQERVKGLLEAAPGPLSAYELLDQMRTFGPITPPTIYRALDALIAAGHAHRLESLNAFVACTCGHEHEVAAFAICDDCGSVTEFSDPQINRRLGTWASGHAFKSKQVTLELKGTCRDCAA